MLRDEPWPEVVDVAGGIAGDDADGFSLKVRRLGLRANGPEEKDTYRERQGFHDCPPQIVNE
jgi:hypothetical protein